MRNNKGITLIALVITIIVMLILVTVTIQVATNGNLFTHAGNAAKGTKSAIADENAILDGNIGNKTIESIVAEQTGGSSTPAVTLIHFTIDGYNESFTAESGMTWEDWVEDERYNTVEFWINSNNGNVRAPSSNGNTAIADNNGRVNATSAIIDNYSYGTVSWR